MGVNHVDLVVSSVERSLPFYRELLGPLGWHRLSEVEGERGETIWYVGGPACSLGLREAQTRGRPSTATRSACTIWRSTRRLAPWSTSARPGCARRAPGSRASRRNTA
ncbi:MAG TPA: VOC family protein, partial [Gaiellaceae bacterium]|nr:VOC family protein [Gaiellaceae bacterium]